METRHSKDQGFFIKQRLIHRSLVELCRVLVFSASSGIFASSSIFCEFWYIPDVINEEELSCRGDIQTVTLSNAFATGCL